MLIELARQLRPRGERVRPIRRNPVLRAFGRLMYAAGLVASSCGRAQTIAEPTAAPAVVACERHWPIVVSRVEKTTADGKPIRGMLATIDLRDPRLEVLVTDPLGAPIAELPKADSVLESVDVWAKRVNADLAINANFFGRADGKSGYKPGVASDVIGLSVSDGKVVSASREYKGKGDPALVFTKERNAAIKRVGGGNDLGVYDAVAGIGGSESDPDKGDQLVTAGKNTSGKARVEPDKRHPRTGVGVSADGWTVYVVAIDGRQPEWSVGMNLDELAELLIKAGASDAINLDGGGSTTLVYRDPGQSSYLMNRPSDKTGPRPVANCLGFRVVPASSGPNAEKVDSKEHGKK